MTGTGNLWNYMTIELVEADHLIQPMIGEGGLTREQAHATIQNLLDQEPGLAETAGIWRRGAEDDTVFAYPFVWCIYDYPRAGDPGRAAHAWAEDYAGTMRTAGVEVTVARFPAAGAAEPVADPINGRLGALVLTGWVADAPTGQDEAFLLLTTPDERAPALMPVVADAIGVGTTPGAPVTDPDVHVTIGVDGWITLHVPGDRYTRPGAAEWEHTAKTTGRAILVVGCAPMPAGLDPDTYTEQYGDTCRIGIVPLTQD